MLLSAQLGPMFFSSKSVKELALTHQQERNILNPDFIKRRLAGEARMPSPILLVLQIIKIQKHHSMAVKVRKEIHLSEGF